MNAWTLWRVAMRSFLLQASWNFQRIQNMGFAFALGPVLRALYPRQEERAAAFRRYLEYFVTHPYCASLILGVVARLEQAQAQGAPAGGVDAKQLKDNMMGPLAALGDSLFWATLKPGLALLGVGVVFSAPAGSAWPALAGPVVFLAAYNLLHLSVRLGGVFAGHARGLDIIQDLRRLHPQQLVQQLGRFFAVIAGMVTAVYTARREPGLSHLPGWDLLLLAGVSAGLIWGLRRGLSPSRLFYLLLGLSLAAGIFIGH